MQSIGMNVFRCFRALSSVLNVEAKRLPMITGLENFRHLWTTPIASLKQIHIKEESDQLTVVQGVYVKSPREDVLIKTGSEHNSVCPLCALNLNLKYTDVLILSQFLRSDGCMLPKRITGLCNKQQKIVTNLVAMAQKAGLMPNFAPPGSKGDPLTRKGTKKFHRTFDESTIHNYKVKYPKKKERVLPKTYALFLQKYRKRAWGPM